MITAKEAHDKTITSQSENYKKCLENSFKQIEQNIIKAVAHGNYFCNFLSDDIQKKDIDKLYNELSTYLKNSGYSVGKRNTGNTLHNYDSRYRNMGWVSFMIGWHETQKLS